MAATQEAATGKSKVIGSTLWVESHRPKKLEEVGLEAQTRQMLEAFIAAREIPHLLLIGPPGSGKTTVARILIGSLDCSVITLNASVERGIDTVRAKIGGFATAMTARKFNIIFLDECDAMTADAQTGLRNLMESYSERTRFILTANAGHKVIGPIQSRCQSVTMAAPPLKERYRILVNVLRKEGIAMPTPSIVLGYAEKYPDMRRMLFAAQKAFLGSADKVLPAVASTGDTNGAEMLTLVETKNWTAIRRIVASGDFDPAAGLRELFWAIPDTHPRAGFLLHVIGRGVHDSGYTPDVVVLFLAVVAEAAEGL